MQKEEKIVSITGAGYSLVEGGVTLNLYEGEKVFPQAFHFDVDDLALVLQMLLEATVSLAKKQITPGKSNFGGKI